MDKRKKDRPHLHLLALAISVSTLALVTAGGLVTTEGAGMAVPDWPTSFGYSMFSLPLSKMVGGVLYEHSHRLLGSGVGLLALALAVFVRMREHRRSVRWLATAVLLAVIIQGVLGGLRVLLVSPPLAMVHAVLAQTFFGLTVALALITSPYWHRLSACAPAIGSRLWPFAPAVTAVIYVQLILGVITRHMHQATPEHVAGAMLVFLGIVLVLYETRRSHAGERALVGTAWTLFALCLAQFVTGLAALVIRAERVPDISLTPLQAVAPTVHVAMGALIFGASVVLTLCAWKRLQLNSTRATTTSNEPPAQITAQA